MNRDEDYRILLLRGVPEPIAEIMSSLAKEVDGMMAAYGWLKPAGQARFVAERLRVYAHQLENAARALDERA